MDQTDWSYRFGDVLVDPHAHRITRAGHDIALEPKAFAVLRVLLDRPGEMLDRDELLDAVWKHRHVAPATLNRIITILRRALGDSADAPRYIETVHGLGYRFIADVHLEPKAPHNDGAVERAEAAGASAGAAAPMAAADANTAASTAGTDGGLVARRPTARLAVLLGLAAAAALVALALTRIWPSRAMPTADKSIAVLPFQNMSAELENAYFVDGMRDEILTRLAAIRDLKVISRSSADLYASHPTNLKTVASQLGVATVLEGSVQKLGNTAHITLQLIDARSDTHLWAESYDRDLDDIFAIEREVAEQVGAALKARLLPEESARAAREPTKSPEAYDLYLRSLTHFNTEDPFKTIYLSQEQGRVEMREAVATLEKALVRDPDFALARALLAQAQMVLYWNFEQRSDELLASVKNSAEEALAQQPSLGEAHLALALYHYYGYHNYALALKEIDLARPTMPNSTKVENYSGLILRRQGQWDRAVASYQRQVALNPRRPEVHGELMTMYWWIKRYAEAVRELAVMRELAGDTGKPSLMTGVFAMDLKADMSLWRPVMERMKPGTPDYAENQQVFYSYAWFTRDFVEAARVAQTTRDEFWFFGNSLHLPRAIWLAWVYTQLGDDDKARPLYEQARRDAQSAIERRPESADNHLVLGFAAAGLGLKDEAVREGIESTELTPVTRDAIDGPDYVMGLSLIYLYVHDYDKALELLQKAVVLPALHMASPGFLKLNPQWDPVRNDPRFAQALASGEAAIKSRPAGY